MIRTAPIRTPIVPGWSSADLGPDGSSTRPVAACRDRPRPTAGGRDRCTTRARIAPPWSRYSDWSYVPPDPVGVDDRRGEWMGNDATPRVVSAAGDRILADVGPRRSHHRSRRLAGILRPPPDSGRGASSRPAVGRSEHRQGPGPQRLHREHERRGLPYVRTPRRRRALDPAWSDGA